VNKTAIEWCDFTWNPVTGCLHGCPYCYARRIAERFAPGAGLRDDCTQPGNGLHEIRRRSGNAADGWRYGFAPTLHSHRLTEPYRLKKPARIFVSSMGDLFGSWVPREWILDVTATVRDCPQHTFLFLTKNPARYAEFDFPANVWIGTTVEDQTRADERIPLLLQTPAAVRFASLEPLLGPVDLRRWLFDFHCLQCEHYFNGADTEVEDGTDELICPNCRTLNYMDARQEDTRLDWLIVGAETGPGARPCKPEWVENIIAQAREAGVRVFVKGELHKQFPIQEWPEVTAR
jgi:protein gp37